MYTCILYLYYYKESFIMELWSLSYLTWTSNSDGFIDWEILDITTTQFLAGSHFYHSFVGLFNNDLLYEFWTVCVYLIYSWDEVVRVQSAECFQGLAAGGHQSGITNIY